MRPYILSETTWKTIRETQVNLAVLPWGALEAHNLHLPYSTDNIETEKIAEEAAGKAWKRGARIIVLPVIPFGVNTGQFDIKVNINMNPSTQFAILQDIAYVLNRHGINKFLIINGHGGNDFKQMIRELGVLYPKLFISTCNWYQSVENSEFFSEGGGHADEMETSLMLYLSPELVLPLSEAGKGIAKRFRIKALNEKWAWSERKWSKVTSDTGIGDPTKATREKGEKYFNAVVEKISDLMVEISEADIDDLYE
jgi:creatinine amidohydrolase